MDFFAIQDFGRDFEVAKASVGTATDKGLIDFDVITDCLAEAVTVAWEERIGNDRLELGNIDLEYLHVYP